MNRCPPCPSTNDDAGRAIALIVQGMSGLSNMSTHTQFMRTHMRARAMLEDLGRWTGRTGRADIDSASSLSNLSGSFRQGRHRSNSDPDETLASVVIRSCQQVVTRSCHVR